MRRYWIATAVVAVVAASTVAVTTAWDSPATNTPAASTSMKTASLNTRTIAKTDTLDGTLRYDATKAVSVAAKGIVTKTRAVGETVENGQALAWVDNRPVTLLYGDLPQWRPLQLGMEDGPDVRQLERALVDLGYARGLKLSVDNTFTDGTETAVKRMQKAIGLAEDGIVDQGEVVFLSSASRITSVTSEVGAAVGQSLVEVSGTTRVVEINLDAADRDDVSVGQKVAVQMPDGKDVEGTIRSIAAEVDTAKEGEETVKVIVDLPDDTNVAFDEAPVEVKTSTELAHDVLTAPVAALLATPGGGYAVERVTTVGTEMIPVELGAFGSGYVEIRGQLSVGDKVSVAS